MKRSDLSSGLLLTAIDIHGPGAWAVLAETYPGKIILAAILRDTRAGLINWGVSPAYPWIEQAGADRLAEMKAGR